MTAQLATYCTADNGFRLGSTGKREHGLCDANFGGELNGINEIFSPKRLRVFTALLKRYSIQICTKKFVKCKMHFAGISKNLQTASKGVLIAMEG